ncbi:epoxide hydrolase [Kribbella turkmenica]|uniref:Epoxide hydrolase n=1 Tax=Kribbella turkmenica TaxID=2530375 RepID=A0A4R4WNW7_9ACTN|nr:epoxide hydrolase [Kribbella turkmenica]
MGSERVAAVRRLRLRVDPHGLYERIRVCADTGQLGAGVVPSGFVKELAEYWVDEYDWRAHEVRLNGFEHLATDLDGQFLHFMHSRAGAAGAEAVLLTHVWPSGVLDAVEAAEGLRSTHHLVVPSLPLTALGELGQLMARLGYDEYLVRDDRGAVPPEAPAGKGERRGLAPGEIAEVRWFNENLNAVNDEQQVGALVLSAAMLAWRAPADKRDSVLTGVMLAWFAPRSEVE